MPKFNIQQEDYEIQKKTPSKQNESTSQSVIAPETAKTESVNTLKAESTKPDKKVSKPSEPKKEAKAMVFKQKVREKKSVHKSFLITESMNQKFSKLAKMNGYNENEFFIEILDQLFESYKTELEN